MISAAHDTQVGNFSSCAISSDGHPLIFVWDEAAGYIEAGGM